LLWRVVVVVLVVGAMVTLQVAVAVADSEQTPVGFL
jgi:hypothetical protein